MGELGENMVGEGFAGSYDTSEKQSFVSGLQLGEKKRKNGSQVGLKRVYEDVRRGFGKLGEYLLGVHLGRACRCKCNVEQVWW